MKSKKAIEFNFVWLFAIIAGAVILILAIYGAVKLGNIQRYQTDTEIAKKISIITDPLQAGFAEGSFGKISFKQETKINNLCYDDAFGKNDISVSTRSRIGEEWIKAGGATSIHNKYIFGGGQGKEFYVFSKPFYFPYKVADLIFITSHNYCFVSPPQEIEDEIAGLNIPNIEIENCTGDSVKVCFGTGSCDINVYGTCTTGCDSNYDEGYIEKTGSRINYVDSLMYAGIFSDKEIYDCNVKRLMYRTAKIAEVFSKKADLMEARGCSSNLQGDLNLLGSLTINASSSNLISVNQIAKQVEQKNDNLRGFCEIW